MASSHLVTAAGQASESLSLAIRIGFRGIGFSFGV